MIAAGVTEPAFTRVRTAMPLWLWLLPVSRYPPSLATHAIPLWLWLPPVYPARLDLRPHRDPALIVIAAAEAPPAFTFDR